MHIFKGNVAIGAAEIGCRLPLIFTTGVLARSIGTEAFGNWTMIIVFQTLVGAAAGLGMANAVSRFAARGDEDASSRVLTFALMSGAAGIVLAFALAVTFENAIGAVLGLGQTFRSLLPLAIALAGASILDGAMNSYFKARMYVGRQVVYLCLRTLAEVIAVAAVFGVGVSAPDLASTLTAYVLILVVVKLAAYPLLFIGSGAKPRLPDRPVRREMLTYALPMMPTALLTWAVAQSDRFTLSHFVSAHDLGIYGIGATFASYTVFLGYAVYPLLLPQAVRLFESGRSYVHLFEDAQRIFLAIWSVFSVLLALWAPTIILWTAGPAFLAAAPILVALSFASGMDQYFGISEYALYIGKRTGTVLALYVAYILGLASCLPLVASMGGAMAVAGAIVCLSFVFNVARYITSGRYVMMPPLKPTLTATVALAAITFSTCFIAHGISVGILVLATGAVVIVGIAIMLAHAWGRESMTSLLSRSQ